MPRNKQTPLDAQDALTAHSLAWHVKSHRAFGACVEWVGDVVRHAAVGRVVVVQVDYIDIPKRTLMTVPGYTDPVEFGVLTSFA